MLHRKSCAERTCNAYAWIDNRNARADDVIAHAMHFQDRQALVDLLPHGTASASKLSDFVYLHMLQSFSRNNYVYIKKT